MEKKANLTLAILFYIAMCALIFIVVVGFFTPENQVENVETIKYPTLYRSGNGLWSPTRR
jgi:uncharacterized alpha/beta hydrolase family protein